MNRKKIGQKLVTLRGSMTREQVAQAVGVTLTAIQMYENGERVPKDEIKIRLAKLYNQSIEEIFFSN